GAAATWAPSRSSACAFDSVRFHTVRASPRRSIASVIPLPIMPVPRNATFAIASLPIQSIAVRGFQVTASFVLVIVCASTVSAQPRVLRWAGDPEGGAPFVEADPRQADRLVGFDVEIANLIASGLGRTPEFVNITFYTLVQS